MFKFPLVTPMSSPEIPVWEQEIISLFVGMFETLGLPRSLARIYGTLYCAERPMLQEEIAQRLQISAGSASQGLKLLQSLGAVHREYPPGERHSVYTAELSLRRLLGTFLDTQLRPKLRNGRERLDAIADILSTDDTHALHRLQTLQTWQDKAQRGLPLLSTLFAAKP